MERIIYRKTLDLHKSGVQFTLQGFQTADNMARTLELSLMASGDTIDLPLEQLLAVMYVTTPNAAEPSIIDCKIKDNTVVCDVPPIVEEGITEVQIKLIETGVEGASGVLATPEFAIEVSKSNMDEEAATQNATFSALETALAKAKGVYDSRVTRIVLSPDCIFSVYYADGTIYTSDALRDVVVNGESLIAKSYARGGTGVRDGEDTDNSMYYSNVSQSSSIEANSAMEKSLELLEEVRKHGVYTAFSFDFEKGELEYVSPMYDFEIDKETGELKAINKVYTYEKSIELLTKEYLTQNAAKYDENFLHLNSKSQQLSEDVLKISEDLKAVDGSAGRLSNSLNETNENLANIVGDVEALKGLTEALPILNGGTGATNIYEARLNLGVAPAIESEEYPGCYYRIVNDEIEWINPPIAHELVEYRTTERHLGKPVYLEMIVIPEMQMGDEVLVSGLPKNVDTIDISGCFKGSYNGVEGYVVRKIGNTSGGLHVFRRWIDDVWEFKASVHCYGGILIHKYTK
jgi:hypothetical protein